MKNWLKILSFFYKKMTKFSASFSFKDHRQLSLPCAVDGLAVLGEPAEKISKFLKKIADFFSFLTNVGLSFIILLTIIDIVW